MTRLIALFLLLIGCSRTFHATLIPDGKPQEIHCVLKPDSEAPKLPTQNQVTDDLKILKSDLMIYLYNPAAALVCDY